MTINIDEVQLLELEQAHAGLGRPGPLTRSLQEQQEKIQYPTWTLWWATGVHKHWLNKANQAGESWLREANQA
jgi:hypothetical protein